MEAMGKNQEENEMNEVGPGARQDIPLRGYLFVAILSAVIAAAGPDCGP